MSRMLPEKFIDRLQEIYPEDHQEILMNMALCERVAYRRNPHKFTDEEFAEFNNSLDSNEVDFYQDARTVPYAQREILVNSSEFSEGKIYIQNLSSMLAPLELDPGKDDWVCDFAAAPGGKTLLLSALMHNEGQISAVEVVKKRFFRLKENLRVANAENVRCYLTDGRSVGKKCPERFDHVLLDAPCSSEARMHPDKEESYSHWTYKKVKECARKQKGLILAAYESLKPGGRLIYCTCSFAPEENEAVLQFLLDQSENEMEMRDIDYQYSTYSSGLTK
ncbi:MAG: RsmB/NOP family class I SAM-dependent RNA methyltransferase, partial [Lentisphaeria bacterium]|nr:RsmB/NOP family class I SAM-dependent RNA methyltransferase [Lentisphaeria bacterium]